MDAFVHGLKTKKRLQATFSEKGTKMTSQLHIPKFEILGFFNKIHENKTFLVQKNVSRHTRDKNSLFL